MEHLLAILATIVTPLLVASETLPFVKKIKANGIVHAIALFLSKD